MYNRLVGILWKHGVLRLSTTRTQTHLWDLWFLNKRGISFLDMVKHNAYGMGFQHGYGMGRQEKRKMDG